MHTINTLEILSKLNEFAFENVDRENGVTMKAVDDILRTIIPVLAQHRPWLSGRQLYLGTIHEGDLHRYEEAFARNDGATIVILLSGIGGFPGHFVTVSALCNQVMYMDPYGAVPPEHIKNWLYRVCQERANCYGEVITTEFSPRTVQDARRNTCSLYSILNIMSFEDGTLSYLNPPDDRELRFETDPMLRFKNDSIAVEMCMRIINTADQIQKHF